MLRLTCSLDPSLTHTHSAFSAEGLGAKLQSGHFGVFFFFSNNGMCHILLVSLITWNMNSENSENSEFQLELRGFSRPSHTQKHKIFSVWENAAVAV